MKIVRKKKLVIQEEIDTCSDCLYCAYNSFYSCETDSGYDCKLAGKRIIDDYDFNKLLEKNIYDIPIPDWCPLEDV